MSLRVRTDKLTVAKREMRCAACEKRLRLGVACHLLVMTDERDRTTMVARCVGCWERSLPSPWEADGSAGRKRSLLSVIEQCWACDATCDSGRCPNCSAPQWRGYVHPGMLRSPGVYIVEAACGMVKIGVTSRDMAQRVREIERQAETPIVPLACLPGAGSEVEGWLHRTFIEACDPGWARAEGLPNASEWFWPSPGLRSLVTGEAFVYDLNPEQIA